MKKLICGTQKFAILRAIVHHPEKSILQIRQYISVMYRNCASAKIKEAMRGCGVTFDGKFHFSQELARQIAQIEAANAKKSTTKVDLVYTPEMKLMSRNFSMREGALDYRNIPSKQL